MPVLQVGVVLKTKPHIKAYLLNNFGQKPIISATHIFHNFLILSLSHTLTFRVKWVPECSEEIKIYISKVDYNLYGCWMNARQMQLFNCHVDFYMKAVLVSCTDTYLKHKPKALLKDALLESLEHLNINEEDWSMDTITRYYLRSRKRRNKELLYKKQNSINNLSDLKMQA